MASFNLLKKLSFTTASAACIALGAVTTAHAISIPTGTVIDTTTNWNGSSIGAFGEPNAATFGQTFTVGSDNVLNDFSFWVNDYDGYITTLPSFVRPRVVNSVIDFAAYVMAWDGNKATGNILYQSGAKSTTKAAGFEQFTFNTGELSLTTGQQYVAFLSASNFFDGRVGIGNIGSSQNTYLGGNLVYSNNGSNFNALTTQNWSSLSDSDLAFKATFTSSKPPQSVPEPASILGLIAVGSWGASQVLKRKKEA